VTGIRSKFLLSILAIAASITSAAANPIMFVPNGDNNAGNVKGEVPVTALGSMMVKGGTANISGRVISVKASSAYIDAPRTVLIGSVLRSEANLASSPPSITGLALFLMGDWIEQIDDQTTQDMIFRKDGHTEGRILGIEGENISVKLPNGKPQSIPLGSVLYIRSPRVFVFKIGLRSKNALQKDTEFQAESTETSFRPTSSARTMSGSVIPDSAKNTDEFGLGPSTGPAMNNGPMGLGGANTFGTPGFPGMNNINPGNLSGAKTAVPNQNDNSFDDGEDSASFSTIRTKWGQQKLTVPAGILD
jgi:hypothetical protein